MIRLNQVLIIGAISLLALAGCNSAEQSTTQTPPAASQSQQTASEVGATKEGFDNLTNVVSNTRTAVEAGDFAKAKKEFNKFEDNWNQVEDGVKAKSPDSYKAIEDSFDQVTGELKGSKPNKEQVLAALQSLNQNITVVAKP